MDIMHLTTLNDLDLLLKLFTGKFNIYTPDDQSTWDCAVFYHNTPLWNAHGETIKHLVQYLPSSFGRAPWNPAKRINSGYKAWEIQWYLYGFGPTLFHHILPHKYWLDFCKLVAGVQILQRHSMLRFSPDYGPHHSISPYLSLSQSTSPYRTQIHWTASFLSLIFLSPQSSIPPLCYPVAEQLSPYQ